MSVNNFLPFCPTDTGTNLLTQTQYAADPQLGIGNQPGVGRSKLVNKALRQATFVASCFTQFLVNVSGGNALDNANPSDLIALIATVLTPKPPVTMRVSNQTTTGTNTDLVFSVVDWDTNSAYNAGTGAYTVQETGYVYLNYFDDQGGGATQMAAFINGVQDRIFCTHASGATINGSVQLKVTAGDLITIRGLSSASQASTLAWMSISQIH